MPLTECVRICLYQNTNSLTRQRGFQFAKKVESDGPQLSATSSYFWPKVLQEGWLLCIHPRWPHPQCFFLLEHNQGPSIVQLTEHPLL